MLDPSQAERVALRCIDVARAFWGIDPAWRITFGFKRLEDGNTAEIGTLTDYMKAHIDLDLTQNDTLEEVWENTGHEVAHVVLAAMEVYRNAVRFNDNESDALQSIRIHAFERTTAQLERVFNRERPYPGFEEGWM